MVAHLFAVDCGLRESRHPVPLPPPLTHARTHSLNDLRDINTANGNGDFRVSFFLDTAFWVPEFAEVHYHSPDTAGIFSK